MQTCVCMPQDRYGAAHGRTRNEDCPNDDNCSTGKCSGGMDSSLPTVNNNEAILGRESPSGSEVESPLPSPPYNIIRSTQWDLSADVSASDTPPNHILPTSKKSQSLKSNTRNEMQVYETAGRQRCMSDCVYPSGISTPIQRNQG